MLCKAFLKDLLREASQRNFTKLPWASEAFQEDSRKGFRCFGNFFGAQTPIKNKAVVSSLRRS